MNKSEFENLEVLIDRYSVEIVLTAITDICNLKAEHVRHNWQDEKLGQVWDRMANSVQTAAESAYNKGI